MRISKISSSSFHLQARDLAVIRDLFESRVMTTVHITRLYFDGRPAAAKKRIHKLKVACLIGERPRKPFEPAVLFLAREGIRVLNERGVLLEYPDLPRPSLERRARVSDITLRHELAVIDVKVAMVCATRESVGLTSIKFSTWPRMNQFDAAGVTVKPDGFMHLLAQPPGSDPCEQYFFIEVDRSTESLDTLVSRAAAYLDYYHSGGFAERNHRPPSEYRKFPFRVVMVFNTTERLNNVAERLLQTNPPILTIVWLTTHAEFMQNPLGAIWVRPLDYFMVTKNTPFDPQGRAAAKTYKRDVARDAFVAERITKHSLHAEEP